MEPTHYLYILIPPRPDFPTTMTEAEGAIMSRHAAYFREHAAAGLVLLAGPTFEVGWGVGVLGTTDRAVAEAFRAGDPAVTSGLMRADLHLWRARIGPLAEAAAGRGTG